MKLAEAVAAVLAAAALALRRRSKRKAQDNSAITDGAESSDSTEACCGVEMPNPRRIGAPLTQSPLALPAPSPAPQLRRSSRSMFHVKPAPTSMSKH